MLHSGAANAINDHKLLLLEENEPAPDHEAARVQWSAWYRRVARALTVISFSVLVTFDFLPFYAPFQWSLFDYEDSFETPIGLQAGVLALIALFVAVVGERAQSQGLKSCSVLLNPQAMISIINVIALASVVPWWLNQKATKADVDTSDLFDAWGYISGKTCKLMMGLCLLPIARRSLWLDAAGAGFPEGVAFHRVTGWWCVVQVVVHTLCYTVDEAMDAMSDFASWKNSNQSAPNNINTTNNMAAAGPRAIGEFDSTEWHAAWRALQVFYWPWASRLNDETGERD